MNQLDVGKMEKILTVETKVMQDKSLDGLIQLTKTILDKLNDEFHANLDNNTFKELKLRVLQAKYELCSIAIDERISTTSI